MDNDFVHLSPSKPKSSTLPRDFDFGLTGDGCIPEESPVDNRSVAKELENVGSGESAYESADDLPNGSASVVVVPDGHIASATTLDDSVGKTSSEVVGEVPKSKNVSHLAKTLIGFAVCVLLLAVAIAMWCGMDNTMLSYEQENFTSENANVSLNLTQNISDTPVKVP